MRDLEPVELAWIPTAPLVLTTTTHFDAPPARVFDAFADAAGWPRWFPLMTKARWLDGSTGGLGAEREVALRGLGKFAERFIAWEPGARFAFTVVRSTSPMLTRFGEDYRLTADGGGTRFDWMMGATPRGAGKVLAPALKILMKRILARAGKNLAKQL
ncbi:MAG: SRPBCC family protein [Deltaproteobacteria bacterium]|nr:SRPBCC family protein [Deltaproteobacteria bacterium]